MPKILAFSPSKWCILMHSGARFRPTRPITAIMMFMTSAEVNFFTFKGGAGARAPLNTPLAVCKFVASGYLEVCAMRLGSSGVSLCVYISVLSSSRSVGGIRLLGRSQHEAQRTENRGRRLRAGVAFLGGGSAASPLPTS